MAEIKLNKTHPLYQEDLKRLLEIPKVEELKGKSFLITGATGLIGTCLIDALMYYNRQEADIQIYAVIYNDHHKFFDSKKFCYVLCNKKFYLFQNMLH